MTHYVTNVDTITMYIIIHKILYSNVTDLWTKIMFQHQNANLHVVCRVLHPFLFKYHFFCFVCKKPGPKLIVVSSQARFSIFLQNEIIIPAGSRCCPGHMYQDNFTSEAVSQVKSTYHPQVLVDRTLCYSPFFSLR
jgi:hypothetical protein